MSDSVPTRHPETPSPTRNIIALGLLGLVAAVCIALGLWQLDRAQLRRDLQHTIAQGRASPALTLAPDTPQDALRDWRAVTAQGVWRHDLTLLLDNRNQDGRPGYWVVTPLRLHDACAHDASADGFATNPSCADAFPPHTAAVLVLRGWLPRRFDATLPDVPAPTSTQRIYGQLLSRVPRIYELPSLWGKPRDSLPDTRTDISAKAPPAWPDARTTVTPVMTNLTLTDAARITGLDLLPVVLQQLPDPAAPSDGLIRQWVGPSLDADKNVGYAIQWFSFAAIALCAALAVVWRTWRRLASRAQYR